MFSCHLYCEKYIFNPPVINFSLNASALTISCSFNSFKTFVHVIIWTTSSEFGTYRLCEQRRFRRACASAQSRQNLRCSLIQAVSQEEPSDRKPDPWPHWMAGHAQLKFVMTECSKTQIRLTGLICTWWTAHCCIWFCHFYVSVIATHHVISLTSINLMVPADPEKLLPVSYLCYLRVVNYDTAGTSRSVAKEQGQEDEEQEQGNWNKYIN